MPIAFFPVGCSLSQAEAQVIDARAVRPAGRREDFGFGILFGKASQRVALVVLVGSFFMPVTGLGFDICWFHNATGLPCPGCGLTRAFASVSHGDFARAWAMHPFIVLAYPLFVAIAAMALMPGRWREAVLQRIEKHRAPMARAYKLGLACFVAFGVARLVAFIAAGQKFP
jgi:hypothetical protein